jgi:XRCC1 N terminal domain
MRKHLIAPIPQSAPALNKGWLDLDGATVVEVTSEDKEHPVESALVPGETRGWRAAASGTQTVRLIFDEPQRLTRIALVFEETRRNVPKSSSYDGLQMVDAHFERLCASSGISVPPTQVARSRSIGLTSPGSPYLN